jgi:putative transposase
MPWKETPKMDQRIKFAQEALHTSNFLALCKEYGISRKTGYKWKERYETYGSSGMEDRSRRPNSHSSTLSEDVVCEIILLKYAHLKWGPLKIRELYRRKHPQEELPSESTFKRVLKKAGLTQRKKRRRVVTSSSRLAKGVIAETPNDIWTIDFKGWWKDADGLKVEPLTVRDEYSRKILDVRLMKSTKTESVRSAFELLFKSYGMPKVIRSDNGPPFASSNSLLGLSRLSAWWLALGIDLERSRPGCPQDNGAHERMHLDIYRELQKEGVGCDQSAFDIWKEEYNSLRPHEALGMQTPDEVYTASASPYKGTPDQLEYENMASRRVHKQLGTISFEREYYKLTSALGGWEVGLKAVDSDQTEVWFSHQLLGHIDQVTRQFRALKINLRTDRKEEAKV